MKAKEEIIKSLEKVVKEISGEATFVKDSGEPKDIDVQILPSEKSENGDYYTNVAMRLGSTLKKKPLDVAYELKEAFEKEIASSPSAPRNDTTSQKLRGASTSSIISKVEVVAPGFVNFFLTDKYLHETVEFVNKKGKDFGKSDKNKGKKVIVEFSSPNIAKPFTVGHLRSTIIGDAIANLFEATGWEVARDNHLGDWGTQFGKQIYAIKTWGDEEKIEESENPVKDLVALYIKFHEEAEKNPELEDAGRAWFKKLEEGDHEARRLWEKCIDWSMKEFNRLYELLGISFTENDGIGYGESFFENKMTEIIEELRNKKLLQRNEGAELIYFPNDKYPPLMILKQDGASLYSTRDLATDKFRLHEHGKDTVIINEVGVEQSLYFNQLYELEKILGWVKDGQRIHKKHGHFRFKEGKMSTRKGNVIWLEDVLSEAKKRAEALSKENTDVDYSEIIGVSALKWNELKRDSIQDIVFDWDEILNMNGNSGPYIQYAYVRTQSILNKNQPARNAPQSDAGGESRVKNQGSEKEKVNEEEHDLLRQIVYFPEVVSAAQEKLSPNLVAEYLFALSQKFNLFYQKHRIAEDEARLEITRAVGQTLKNGLNLLGIQTVEKM